jgi:hypothetical protein
MPEWAWAELDARAAEELRAGDTRARALGMVLVDLLTRPRGAASSGSAVHWLDWERDKAQRLLARGARAA